MRIGCLNKTNNVTEYIYNYSRFKILDLPFGGSNYYQYELPENKVPEQFIWDEMSQTVIEDENYIAPVIVTPVPVSVKPRQMRIALVLSNISLTTIDAIINGLPEPNKTIAKVTWEYSNEIQRNNPLLLQLAPAVGLTTTEQIDNLFILAATV